MYIKAYNLLNWTFIMISINLYVQLIKIKLKWVKNKIWKSNYVEIILNFLSKMWSNFKLNEIYIRKKVNQEKNLKEKKKSLRKRRGENRKKEKQETIKKK